MFEIAFITADTAFELVRPLGLLRFVLKCHQRSDKATKNTFSKSPKFGYKKSLIHDELSFTRLCNYSFDQTTNEERKLCDLSYNQFANL